MARFTEKLTVMICPEDMDTIRGLAVVRDVSEAHIVREIITFGLDTVQRRTAAMEKIKK